MKGTPRFSNKPPLRTVIKHLCLCCERDARPKHKTCSDECEAKLRAHYAQENGMKR